MRYHGPWRRRAHDRHRRRRAMPGWRWNPRERRASPIEDGVLVAGAGRPAAAATSANETEYRVVVRERRNVLGPAPTGARPNCAGPKQAPSITANTRQVASLDQPPNRRP